MIYIKRTLWLLGYMPMFVISMMVFIVLICVSPLIDAFYYVKTGSLENMPFSVSEFPEYAFDWYHDLEP